MTQISWNMRLGRFVLVFLPALGLGVGGQSYSNFMASIEIWFGMLDGIRTSRSRVSCQYRYKYRSCS